VRLVGQLFVHFTPAAGANVMAVPPPPPPTTHTHTHTHHSTMPRRARQPASPSGPPAAPRRA
jgi:hypothetical protein